MTVLGPLTFSGGWNTRAGPYDMPENCFVDGQNMDYFFGHMAKKKGNVRWSGNAHPGATDIRGLGIFQTFLVATSGSKIAYVSTTTGSQNWTDITGAVSFSSATNVWMDTLNSILVIGGINQSNIIKWTGSGNCAVLGGSPPADSTAGIAANGYFFLGGSTANPSRVQWSAVGDPETWPAANFVDVNKGDGFSVNTLLQFGEDIIIWKSGSMWRLYTNQLSATLGPLVNISQVIGCPGPQAADRLPDGRIVFVGSNSHIYIFDGNTLDDISDPNPPRGSIQNILSALALGTGAAGFGSGFVLVFRSKGQVWFSYPFTYTNQLGNQFHGVIFIYDYINNIWLPPYPDHVVAKAVFNSAINPQVLMTGGSDGFAYEEDTLNANTDSEKNFNNSFDSFVTKTLVFGADAEQFIPRSLYFGVSCGSLSATVYYGANGFFNPTFSKTVTGGVGAAERRRVIPLTTPSTQWNTAQVRFEASISNQPFTLSPFYFSDEIERQS